jgi:hypothetical protein
VKQQEFDKWMAEFRIDRPADELDDVVNSVVGQIGQ